MKTKIRLTESELTSLIKRIVNEKWEGDVKVEKTGEHAGKTISEINAEIKKLKAKSEKLQDEGKKVPASLKKQMSELYFAKRAKKDWPGKGKSKVDEAVENFFNPEAMETGGAIATMVGTTIGLLGIAGWDYLKEFYHQLRNTEGKEQEAMELESIISDYEENKMSMDDNEPSMDDSSDEVSMNDEEPLAETIRRHIRRY